MNGKLLKFSSDNKYKRDFSRVNCKLRFIIFIPDAKTEIKIF